MTIEESYSGSGMTSDPIAPSEASPVRIATPYLEVERQPTFLAGGGDPAGAGAGQPGPEEEGQGRRST
jgi:hypothetical protein